MPDPKMPHPSVKLSFDTPDRDPRIYFAAERTMLAWVRTGIALMGFGFVVARFGLFLRETAALQGRADTVQSTGHSLWAGISLVVIGVFVNVFSTMRHFKFRRRFERGEAFITPGGLGTLILTVLLALLGIAMTVYLLALSR